MSDFDPKPLPLRDRLQERMFELIAERDKLNEFINELADAIKLLDRPSTPANK